MTNTEFAGRCARQNIADLDWMRMQHITRIVHDYTVRPFHMGAVYSPVLRIISEDSRYMIIWELLLEGDGLLAQ
jgi:hypothetical protein